MKNKRIKKSVQIPNQNCSTDEEIFELPNKKLTNPKDTELSEISTVNNSKNNDFVIAFEYRKYLKHRYKLLCCTESRRQKILQSKISEILAESINNDKPILIEEEQKLNSEQLSAKLCLDQCIFQKNSLSIEKDNIHQFFVSEFSNYITSKIVPEPGCLLKNWQRISGRDRSPNKNALA